MKRLFLLPLLVVAFCSVAYAEKVSNKGGRATGSFEMTALSGTIQATYYIYGTGQENIIVMIVPRQEVALNAHIVDVKGKEQMALKPETVSQRYVKDIDLSKLAQGDYFFELTYADGTAYRIPFSRE
jgi:hypothetical protein